MSQYIYEQVVIVDVHDGDTVVVDIDLGFGIWFRGMRIRLLGINAPELGTYAGAQARAYLEKLLSGGGVTLESFKDKADKYGGRWLGTLYPRDLGGHISANQKMLDSGMAKPYDGSGPKP